ncbi:MAG: T9SS type A sorting domain-containing protein [Bacteroidia bacterium]|jgi:hypothetical protein|nr:T9SS type A sorting domain-containing protein [Bacteroidia bacterium]
MKTAILIILILLFGSIKTNAQFNNHKFTQYVQPFSYLSQPKHLLHDTLWYGSSYYNTLYGGTLVKPLLVFYTDTFLYWNFELALGTITLYNKQPYNTVTFDFCKCRIREINKQPPFASEINYQYDSIIGAHQFEYRNVGVVDTLDRLAGAVNMQIWFYNNGVIEYHFGQNESNTLGFLNMKFFRFGSFYWRQTDTSSLAYVSILTEDPLSPTHLRLDFDAYRDLALANKVHINGFPPEGTVYRFSPPATGLNDKHTKFVPPILSPNPAQTQLQIQFDYPNNVNRIVAIDSKGARTILDFDIQNQTLFVQSLTNGLYVLEMETDAGVITSRLLIQR